MTFAGISLQAGLADPPLQVEAGGHGFFGCQVDADTLRSRRRLRRRPIEPIRSEPAGELIDESQADKAGAASHDEQRSRLRLQEHKRPEQLPDSV
jgi:hypothetical protein